MATWMGLIAPVSFSKADIAGNCILMLAPTLTYGIRKLIQWGLWYFNLLASLCWNLPGARKPRMVINWTCTGMDLFHWSWAQFSADIQENGWLKLIWNLHISQSSSWARKSLWFPQTCLHLSFQFARSSSNVTLSNISAEVVFISVSENFGWGLSVDERMHNFFSKEFFNKSVASSSPGSTIDLWFWP